METLHVVSIKISLINVNKFSFTKVMPNGKLNCAVLLLQLEQNIN